MADGDASHDRDAEMGPTLVLFEPLPGNVPSAIRFRAMLKAALRA